MKTLRYWALQALRYAESVDLYLAKQRDDWQAASIHRAAISRIDSKLDALSLQ